MLIYCAWCGQYQGATAAQGHQRHQTYCEIDSSTICPACQDKYVHGGAANLIIDLPTILPADYPLSEH